MLSKKIGGSLSNIDSNERRKRKFDSKIDFDDSIVACQKDAADFFDSIDPKLPIPMSTQVRGKSSGADESRLATDRQPTNPIRQVVNAERPRDEEMASAGIVSAPRENTEES
jgi:hypothetical protein